MPLRGRRGRWPSPAAPTKKYVGREVGEVNQKVDTLSAEVEKTQERVKQQRGPHRRRRQAVSGRHRRRQGLGRSRAEQATEAERAAKGKLIYTVTLSNDKVTLPGEPGRGLRRREGR